MKIVLLCWAYILATANARSTTTYKICDGIQVDGINHEKEVLKTITQDPYQLAIDYDTNTLFFSYTSNDKSEIFKSAYLNLKTNEYSTIPGIAGGFANAVDKQSHTVYLGASDGIYKFNYDTKTAQNIHITDSSIWQLSHSGDLYYTTFPHEKLYRYNGEVVELVSEVQNELVLVAAVDNDGNIIFSNTKGLFAFKKSNNNVEFLGPYHLNGITHDINGKIFFSTPRGIYSVNEKLQVIQLAEIPNVFGVAIEGDGSIIYANKEAIIRLKPSKEICYTEINKNVI